MRVLVDADACPVKDTIIEETEKQSILVTLVASYSHFSEKEYPPHVSIIWVDSGSDRADFKIMQLARKGDIIVTQDYGLASMLLSKECTVLHHAGYEFTQDNIDTLITSRHLSAVERRQSGRVSGVKSLSPFSDEKQKEFKDLLKSKLKS